MYLRENWYGGRKVVMIYWSFISVKQNKKNINNNFVHDMNKVKVERRELVKRFHLFVANKLKYQMTCFKTIAWLSITSICITFPSQITNSIFAHDTCIKKDSFFSAKNNFFFQKKKVTRRWTIINHKNELTLHVG